MTAKPSEAPRREFLGWDRPVVDLVVERLLAAATATGGLVDLGDTMVVVPTRQSGRRLRRALALAAAVKSGGTAGVVPPRVVMPEFFLGGFSGPAGESGERLLRPAPPMVMELAWAEVLRSVPLARFEALFPVEPPETSHAWAVQVAAGIERARAALADGGYLVRTLVDGGGSGTGLPDFERWRDLAVLEDRVRALLRSRGWSDLQESRLEAARGASVPEGGARVVVACVPDPSPLALMAWRQLAGEVPFEIWVHAPVGDAGAFDDWGRPIPDEWASRVIPLDRGAVALRQAADPDEQGALAMGALRARVGRESTPVCLASADPDAAAAVIRALEAAGLRVFDPEGTPFTAHALHHLVRLVAELVRENRFRTAAALVRCPLVADALRRRHPRDEEGNRPPAFARRLGAAFDELHARRLPASVEEAIEMAGAGGPRIKDPEIAVFALREIASIREDFVQRGLQSGAAGLLGFLFAGTVHEAGDPATRQLAAVVDAINSAVGDVASFVGGGPRAGKGRVETSVAEQLDQVLRGLAASLFYPERQGEDVDLIGWLDVPWDDSPDLVLAGFNDGAAPEAVVGDPFLPDSLRETLGLRTNAERFARDAYLLSSIAGWRGNSGGEVTILFGRTGADGSPLRPSRLLFQCEDAALPGRVLRLLGGEGDEAGAESGAVLPAWEAGWRLRADAPSGERAPEPPISLRVTDFRLYLECPFRFYLQRVRRMEAVDPTKREMDALDFGNLCHHALEAFANDESLRDSRDGAAIAGFLTAEARRRVAAWFGRRPPVPVQLQLESAIQRLRRAAEVQAAARAEGWRIEHAELAFGRDQEWTVGGMPVTGTIDRIDRHEKSGMIRVLDYKSSGQEVDPRKAHVAVPRRGDAADTLPEWRRLPESGDGRSTREHWINLQLPLYCQWIRENLDGEAMVESGYFNLPAALDRTEIVCWREGGEARLLESARACAEGVVDLIRAGVFWPPSRRVGFDAFSPLATGLPLEEIFHPGALAEIGGQSGEANR